MEANALSRVARLTAHLAVFLVHQVVPDTPTSRRHDPQWQIGEGFQPNSTWNPCKTELGSRNMACPIRQPNQIAGPGFIRADTSSSPAPISSGSAQFQLNPVPCS
jgi:hypothetical protein